ncbi:MAG: peptide transporter, partial [Lentisphaerae bacterium]|nr:peptide transporter [Lentisphaerota bacterium]
IQKMDHYGLGYVLYRLTSDVERLPFPMAPVGASGIVSLTEVRGSREPWRWRCFSIGGMLGLVFGAVYVGVPAVTGALLAKPIQLIPIPWVDLTPQLTRFLPATPINLTFDLGSFLVGTVLPFWAVMGGIFGVAFTFVLNPILYHSGVLHNWTPQMGFVDAIYSNHIDFYLSFGIGLTVAVAVVSLGRVFRPLMNALRSRGKSSARDLAARYEPGRVSAWRTLITNNRKRGDFSIFIALGIYVFTSTFWIGLSTWLIPGFPWYFFAGYAVFYVPLISYATAKLEGICGQAMSLPMIREATFILSGYQGVAIWFAPAPVPNYGMHVREFRILELTGTKIKGQIKAQIVTIPIVLISSLVFSTLLWQMAPVPSAAYPFADKMWDLQAKMMALTFTSTMEGGSLFMESWNWSNFGWGMGSGVVLYAVLSQFGLPTMLVFGMVRGLAESHPGAVLFQGVGALVGRFYLKKRFGSMWLKYAPVLLAGFSCGMGLMALISVGFSMLTRMMSPLIF